MNPKGAVGVDPERSSARPKPLKEQGIVQFIETLRTDLDGMLRARLREELDDVLRLLIDRALWWMVLTKPTSCLMLLYS